LANIHGVEWVGSQVALGFARALRSQGQLFGELQSRAEVWVIPCANPDGYARTGEQRGAGTLAELRTNANGVDLNRNFPLPHGQPPSWIPGTGSAKHGHATYRGTQPLSEPETAALDGLLARERFHAVLSLHSFMGTLIPARVTDADCYGAYARLCREFRRHQAHFGYRRVANRTLDVYTGELEDHAHHVYRAWACCVEIFPVSHSLKQHVRAPSLFWRFNPRLPDAYLANDAPGIAAFFLDALRLERPVATR
jgi:hypothetical protein